MTETFGVQLRDWRARRRLSQLGLALEAEVSQRHVSFLESGRARPSREMILQLSEALDLPLRARNALLLAAGFAPAYPETPLDDASLAPIRAALDRMMTQHMPLPAMLFDRHWNVLAANPMATALFGVGGGAGGGTGPVNVLRLIANNPAMTAQFENWPEIAHYMMARLKLEAADSGGDPVLDELIALLGTDPVFQAPGPAPRSEGALICLRLRLGGRVLALFSSIVQFGTAQDITVKDLRLELFFPGDGESEEIIQDLVAQMVQPNEC